MATHMCNSLQDALGTLKKHEIETNTRFAVYTSSRDFGNTSIQRAKHVYWEDRQTVKIGRLDYMGVPFIILGTKTFDCQFGKDRKMRAKEKRKAEKVQNENDHNTYTKGKKFLLCDSKKLNCEARCVMREVCMFPSYKVTDNSTGPDRKLVAEDLLCRLQAGEDIPHQRQVITCLPAMSDHAGHPVGPGAVVPEPIDAQVAKKIKELVSNGIKDAAILKTQLYSHVKTICKPPPHPANKRFYPLDKTIRNHMYKARNEKLIDDQSKIASWVSEMKASGNDFIYCRLKADKQDNVTNKNIEVGSKFLFAYQSAHQKKLLSRYGCMVLLDATYKTTLYDLPLFFIVVKTNVDYQVVGCFITEDETANSIAEALTIMRDQCFQYSPPMFMTDFDESEISAIEKVFEGTRVLICDFHREQAWERWTSAKNNAMGHKDDILSFLRKIAMSRTVDGFNKAVKELKSSQLYTKNSKLQHYFERVWYPHHKRWSKAYRSGAMTGTTNGVEVQHKLFKHRFLNRQCTYSLYSMLEILIKDFFPSRYIVYADLNQICSGKYRKYSPEIPTELFNRPKRFVKHCIEQIDASKDIEKINVKEVSSGSYEIVVKGRTYEVMLGDQHNYPWCVCGIWASEFMPCVHMFSAMSSKGALEWDILSPLYMQSVYCTIDEVSSDNIIRPEENFEALSNDENMECLGPVQLSCEDEKSVDTAIDANQKLARDSLKKLINLSYNISSTKVLKTLTQTCNKLISDLEAVEKSSTSSFVPLRRRRSMKKFAKRSGWKSSILKKHSKLDISKDPGTKKPVVGVKPIPMDSCFVDPGPGESPALVNNDQPSMEQVVDQIWQDKTDASYEIGRVGPYTLTNKSIKYLENELSDEVIDSYLSLVCRGKNALYINCVVMTSIFDANEQIHALLQKENLFDYDYCLGAINEHGMHWTLLIICPKQRKLVFMNPLGETERSNQFLLERWYAFLHARYTGEVEQCVADVWTLESPEHARQIDGRSCGVYVLKLAEIFLNGGCLQFSWTPSELMDTRKSIAACLLSAAEQAIDQTESVPPIESPVIMSQQVFPICHSRASRKRKRKDQRKSSIYLYEKPRKMSRTYCVCRTKNDGSKYWCCDGCDGWFHPICIGQKEEEEMDTFLCPNCMAKKEEKSIAVTITDEDSRRITGKTVLEMYPAGVEHLTGIIGCMDSSCNKEDHSRHHQFLLAPNKVVKEQKKKFGFGSHYYLETTMEILSEKLTTDLLFKIPDKKYPATSLPSMVIRGAECNSVLWNLFIANKLLAPNYILYVLSKELLIWMASMEDGQTYDKCQAICQETELDCKVMFGI